MDMPLLFRESDLYVDDCIECSLEHLYDILMNGADVQTDCPELAEELRKMFPASKTHCISPVKRHSRKRRKRRKK